MGKEQDRNKQQGKNEKQEQLNQYRQKNTGSNKKMTDDTGAKVSNDRTSLRAGKRGPLLFEDFHFYKKQTQFSRERIPEKVVHARGFGVYGEFETYESMKHITKADFLQEAGQKTPVFVRFSNFVGNKGSKDTAVDIRGFAVKFYTQEGNYDSLSLQFPVFILSDAMKFMDVTHAAKPNPKSHVPQATVAHDNFWDYMSSNQESTHMVMWLMSMRGRPRSWRTMAGWPINTFRFINEEGKSTFVRFKWTPKLGVHSLLLEEANLIGGVDPDFHRHDIIRAIENGAYPEYELGVQLIDEENEFNYDFDILDDTKLWPEEDVPVQPIGKMTLNRLVDNFFAEEEQSVFDPASVVPGIDFTNDPVLQGRAFAYRDTELYRQNSANINDIPVNKPIAERNYNNRDGYQRHRIDSDMVHYQKNDVANNTPAEASAEEGGYVNYPEKVEGEKTREVPSDSFNDYFSQARLFWNSLSTVEREDLINSFNFHIGKVKDKTIRQKVVDTLGNVDTEMATAIANAVGVNPPSGTHVSESRSSPALSMMNSTFSAETQKIGIIIGNGFQDSEVKEVLKAFDENNVFYDLISESLAPVKGSNGMEIEPQQTFTTAHPVLYDGLYVVGGEAKKQDKFDKGVKSFIQQTYEHYKPIAVSKEAKTFIPSNDENNLSGVLSADESTNFVEDLLDAIAKQRFWDRV
ncbi:catalase [Allobacillus sp. SKP2-8]|uniref:catalase n=1 Tax=unclassified Allobacillus TaxID=2628859 RepID=UPI001183DF47|nr:catalase [Allobacillus sp. SKP2-8]TSJ61776.1 catalase [Allobacillus sp. SKP2-8]